MMRLVAVAGNSCLTIRSLIVLLTICFCYSEACLWNNLPQDLNSVGSIGQFKRRIEKVSEILDSHTASM